MAAQRSGVPDRAAAPAGAAARFGAYGKIPALGDFFRIGLPQSFVDPWDLFVQSALAAGRTAHGAGWLDLYMSAPIWRFALAPGLAGPDAVVGVVMPSVDRVGRQFPLTLAAVLPAAPPLWMLAAQRPALDALELAALDSLDDAMGRDGLAARLETTPPLPMPPPAQQRRSGGGLVVAGEDPGLILAELALAQAPGGVVFSAAVDRAARLMVLPRLPEGAAAAALFDLDAPFWGEAAA